MKLKHLFLLVTVALIALSAVPLAHVDAKELYTGGSYDLSIYLNRDRHEDDYSWNDMYVTPEEFDLLLDDMEKLPKLFNNTILPQMKEQFIIHENELEKEYVEYVRIDYRMNENSMYISIKKQQEYVSETVKIEPRSQDEMSIINHLDMAISVYANLGRGVAYEGALKQLQSDTLKRAQIVASELQLTMNKYRDELFEGSLYGDQVEDYPSLANMALMDAINVSILEDIVRVSVYYPITKKINEYTTAGDTGVIDEIKRTALYLWARPFHESLINSVILGEPEIVTEYSTPLANFPAVGWELIVQSELNNTISGDIWFTYILQVKDENGITVWLESIEAPVSANQSINVALDWTPESTGRFEIETFLWSDLEVPFPFSPSRHTTVTVTTR